MLCGIAGVATLTFFYVFVVGYQVVRLENPTAQLLNSIPYLNLDVFGRGESDIDFLIPPNFQKGLASIRKYNEGRLNYRVIQQNVQTLLDKERIPSHHLMPRSILSANDSSWFQDFHSYNEMVQFLTNVCESAKGICTKVPSIGKTVEGRDIFALQLGKNGTSKPQVYVQGMVHAREWASTTTVQYLVHQLLTTYGTDSRTRSILDQVDFTIVPMANPDGYEHSRNGNRMWRKNRSKNANGLFGTDLNRNWNYHWSTHSSASPDSDVYHGPSVESEPETKALVKTFKSLPRVIAAIDVHCFSELILKPWGDVKEKPKDEAQFEAVAKAMSEEIQKVSGEHYTPMQAVDLYPTSGSAADWFYSQTSSGTNGQKIHPYGISIELRPGKDAMGAGFLLPKEQIIATGQEMYPAFLLYVEHALKNPLAA
jgi:hypothetical protein